MKRLAVTYRNVGIHTGRTAQYWKSNYPNPKKGAAPLSLHALLTIELGCYYHYEIKWE